MATICITGSSDGIGRAAARALLDQGHRVLVHARSEQRGRAVVDELGSAGGDVALVTGDLSSLAEVRQLADQIREHGPLDVLAHNAGVWVRGDIPRETVDGLETTFAVNVLAPHLLTALLRDAPPSRLLWLGSGMVGSGRPDPATLGQPQAAQRAYADSKAADVALAIGWGRRLPNTICAAIDPGWVKTKLASTGAPGEVEQGADTLVWCCTADSVGDAPYWKNRRPASVPGRLQDPELQDALLAACDRLAGLD